MCKVPFLCQVTSVPCVSVLLTRFYNFIGFAPVSLLAHCKNHKLGVVLQLKLALISLERSKETPY